MTQYLQQTKIPAQKSGPWEIIKFKIDQKRAASFNLQQIISGTGERAVHPGKYTKLVNHEAKVLMMSDTPAELMDHRKAVYKATGHCLIAGLGLGIIVEACLRKPNVTKVTVLEIDKNIIKMTGKHLYKTWTKDQLEIIHCNALEWKPPKNAKYDMAWFDIWPDISEDNWEEYKLLHRRYGRKAIWKGSWGRDYILRWKRENNRGYW